MAETLSSAVKLIWSPSSFLSREGTGATFEAKIPKDISTQICYKVQNVGGLHPVLFSEWGIDLLRELQVLVGGVWYTEM